MAAGRTRSKTQMLGDVEPDDATFLAISGPSVNTESVTPIVVTAEELEPMSVEPARPVSAPSTHSPEGILSSKGGPRTPGPVGSPPVAFTLRYPSSLTGPINPETPPQSHSRSLPPTAAARGEPTGLTLAPDVGPRGPTSPERFTLGSQRVDRLTHFTSHARLASAPSSSCERSLSPPILSPIYIIEQWRSVRRDKGRIRSQREFDATQPNVSRSGLVDVWADVGPTSLPHAIAEIDVSRPGPITDVLILGPVVSAGADRRPAGPALPTLVDIVTDRT